MARINVPAEQYTPFSTESPGPAVGQRLNVHASPEAFGSEIGSAIGHFGDVLGHVSDQLFNRAMQIQDDKNQADAREAVNSKLTELGLNQEKFQTLSGKDPSDQLEGHLAGINKSIADTRAKLPNAVVQKHYDAEIAPIARQYIVRSVGHAGAEQRKYEIGTIKAQEGLDEKSITDDPTSTDVWDRVHNNIQRNAEDLGRREGWSPQQKTLYAQDRESALKLSQLKGMARNDPLAGEKILDDAIKNKTINPDDAVKARAVLEPRVDIVLGRGASQAVNAHPEGPGNAPQWTQQEHEIEKGVAEPVSRVARQFNIDHGNYGVHIGGGTKDSLDVIFPQGTNLEPAMQQMHEVASKIGVPVDLSVVDGKVRIEMKTGTDPKDVRPPEPEGEGSRVGRASAYNKDLRPNNLNIDHTTNVITSGDYNKQQSFRRDEQRNYDNNVGRAVLGPKPGEEGSRAGSMETLFQRLQEAGQMDSWEKLDPKRQAAYIKEVNATKAVRTVVEHRNKLMGMSAGTPDEINEFLNHDVNTDNLLSDRDKAKIFDKQTTLRKEKSINPDVSYAMSVLKAKFPTFGTIEKDRVNVFRGFLMDEMEQVREQTKKRMTDDEIEKMGATFLQQIPSRSKPWWASALDWTVGPMLPDEVREDLNKSTVSTGRPLYEAVLEDVPEEVVQRIVADEMKNTGVAPSPDKILRTYVAAQYIQLHGKPSKPSGAK
jgi:hypothetical protein